jgi:hypothetical protein
MAEEPAKTLNSAHINPQTCWQRQMLMLESAHCLFPVAAFEEFISVKPAELV